MVDQPVDRLLRRPLDEPASCPMCGVALEPQNYYQYNGDRLVRLDGTSQILGI